MKTTKAPVVRSGQHRPYVKGTQAQIDQRRGYVMRLMDRGEPKMLIHAVIKTFFQRQWRTVDRDIDMIGGCGYKWLARTRGGYIQITLPASPTNPQNPYENKQM